MDEFAMIADVYSAGDEIMPGKLIVWWSAVRFVDTSTEPPVQADAPAPIVWIAGNSLPTMLTRPASGHAAAIAVVPINDTAVAIVIKDRKCSTSYIQRKLAIGYNKAARLVEQMEDEGLVSAANHVGKREIMVPEQQ